MNKTEIVVLLIVKHLCIMRDIILFSLISVIFLTFSHSRPHPFAVIQKPDLTEVCELRHRSLSHFFFCPLERKIKDMIAIHEVRPDLIDNTCYFLLTVRS